MKKLYLIGNAHLDPVWQWQWQEGSAEAKATIRSALDRMKEFPDFRFVCSSASVYQWVEEFAPDMFEEIKERVKEGRFIIVGGWHVQPDCNLPSGEGFARQSLYAQRYFKDKFGVTAKVGYNVDSFGHCLMLPQILQKSGMTDYIFMRPAPHEKEMESNLFQWISPDGSSVMTYRILDPYCFNFDTEEKLQMRIDYLEENIKADVDEYPFLYGVGNHGGGPTIRNLELLEEYRKGHPELEMVYSDITDFFDSVRDKGIEIPEYRDDLQHHASGCYSAVPEVKNGIRRSECNLIAAEIYSIMAQKLCGKREKTAVFADAWRNVCFLHFHDVMDGCSIKEAYDDAAYMYGVALNTAAVEENNALQSISWAIDTSDNSKGTPLVVFNSNSFAVEELVRVNSQCKGIVDNKGNRVLSQMVHSTVQECFGRGDTIFKANVPAMGYAVYYLDTPVSMHGEKPDNDSLNDGTVSATTYEGPYSANRKSETVLENEIYRIEFEPYSGYILSIVDKRTEKELLSDRGAVPVVIDEYYHDTWSHGKNFFANEIGRFSDAEVSVFENGPVRATVKVVSYYHKSTLTQYFSLEKGCDRLKVRAIVDWQEKHKMLKLAWPTTIENPKAYYEIPFGVIERPADGEEEPGITWSAVRGTNGGIAILNNNTYSSSVKESVIYHTIVRSPIYGDHGGARTKESEFTGQGRTEFSYEIMQMEDSFAPVIRAARQLNKPVTNIIETWHDGSLKALNYEGIHIDKENIMLSACKRSEDGKGLVVRLYETDGLHTDVAVTGDILAAPLNATFTPYSINTYYLEDGSKEWKEVLLTEYEMTEERCSD